MTIRSRIRAALSLRDSPIGRGVPRWLGALLAAVALAAVAIDLGASPWFIDYDDVWPRVVPAFVAIAVMAVALRMHPDAPCDGEAGASGPLTGRSCVFAGALGLRVVPLPSGRYWLRATLGMVVLFGLIVLVTFSIYLAMHGMTWPAGVPPPSLSRVPRAAVQFPLVEELIYRWAMVTGLAALGLRWTAVVLSGAAFGYLHVRYGVAAGNNVAAGFVFAWMYLRSGAITMPVAYHALGNLAVLVLNYIGYRILY